MKRENRVRRQARRIYSRVRDAGVELGVLDQPSRAPHRDDCFLVRVARRHRKRSRRFRSRRAPGCDHGELYLVERRGNLSQHLKEIRRRLALRRSEIYRNRYRPDSGPPRGLQSHVQRGRTTHLAEKIARRARVAADLLGQDAQQEQLGFCRTHPSGQLQPAHQAPNVLRVERACPPLQRDYVVKEMRLAASRRAANPEHGPLRLSKMLIEDFPRAFGRACEHVARDGRDARRRLQSQSFGCRRLEFELARRARAPLSAVVRFHRMRQHCHCALCCAPARSPALLQLDRRRL